MSAVDMWVWRPGTVPITRNSCSLCGLIQSDVDREHSHHQLAVSMAMPSHFREIWGDEKWSSVL